MQINWKNKATEERGYYTYYFDLRDGQECRLELSDFRQYIIDYLENTDEPLPDAETLEICEQLPHSVWIGEKSSFVCYDSGILGANPYRIPVPNELVISKLKEQGFYEAFGLETNSFFGGYSSVIFDKDGVQYAIQKAADTPSDLMVEQEAIFKANYYADNAIATYYIYDYISPYRSFVETLEKKKGFQNAVTAWKATEMLVEGNYLDLVTVEQGFYEMVLFDILHQFTVSDKFVDNIKEHAAVTTASLFKDLAEYETDAYETGLWDYMKFGLSQEEFNTMLGEHGKTVFGMKLISGFGKFAEYAGSCWNYIEKATQIMEMEKAFASKQDIFTEMAAIAKKSSLRESIIIVRNASSGEMSDAAIMKYFVGESVEKEMVKELTEKLWGEILKINPLVRAFSVGANMGLTVGKNVSNFLFSSEKTIEQYTEMAALRDIEEILRDVVMKCENDFVKNPNEQNAKRYIAAYETLIQTYMLGGDYAKKFYLAIKNEAVIGLLFRNQKDYEESLDSLDNMKQWVADDYMILTELCDDEYYHAYFDATELETLEISPDDPIDPEELDRLFQDLISRVTPIKNMVINKDSKLTKDTEIIGSLFIESGTLDLNGYTLKIAGDVIHSGGTLNINEGFLDVGSNYLMQTITSVDNEVIEKASSGKIVMQNTDDKISVDGDFLIDLTDKMLTNTCMLFDKGSITIGGNFTQLGSSVSTGQLHYSESLKESSILFTNLEEVTITVENPLFRFPAIAFTDDAIVNWNGYINIQKFMTDVDINGVDIGLQVISLVDKKIIIKGDVSINPVYYPSIWDNLLVDGGSVTVNGSITQDKGNITIASGTIKATNNFTHNAGNLSIVSGELNIGNSYLYKNISGSALFEMTTSTSKMKVDKNFIFADGDKYSYCKVNLTNGAIRVGGNINIAYSGFKATGQHIFSLVGEGQQDLQTPLGISESAQFSRFSIESDKTVIWDGKIDISKLETDITIASDSILYLGNISLNGKKVEVNAPLTYSGSYSSTIDLQAGKLTVNGDYYLAGEIRFNEGALYVNGKFSTQSMEQSIEGEKMLSPGHNKIVMENDKDLLCIAGDAYFSHGSDQWQSHKLSAGRIEFGGNVTFADVFDYYAEGTHQTVFNSAEQAKIAIANNRVRFNKLAASSSNPLLWEGYMNIESLDTDMQITASALKIYNLNLSNRTLSIQGNAQIGYEDGSRYYGMIDLQGGLLNIYGDLTNTMGEIRLNHGSLHVSKNYNMIHKEQYSSSIGNLVMNNTSERFVIDGNAMLAAETIGTSSFTAGTIEVKGDLSIDGYGFQAKDAHMIYLNGNGTQKVDIPRGEIIICQLKVGENAELLWNGCINVEKMISNASIISDNTLIESWGINGQNVQVTGDISMNVSRNAYNDYCELTILDLQGGTLRIDGDFSQKVGHVRVNQGSLIINGNYNMPENYMNSATDGTLTMSTSEDYVYILNDWTVRLQFGRIILDAGILEVAGNIHAIINSPDNLAVGNEHELLLSGTEKQDINLSSHPVASFNIVRLTRPLLDYTFYPNPCWRQLKEVGTEGDRETRIDECEIDGISGQKSSTHISLTFAVPVNGLTSESFEIIPKTGDARISVITGGGRYWTISLYVLAEGTIDLLVHPPSGYSVLNPRVENIEVYKGDGQTNPGDNEPTDPEKDVLIKSLRADGIENLQTTTYIEIKFDAILENLRKENFILSDKTGSAVITSLEGSDYVWKLFVDVKKAGLVDLIVIAPENHNVVNSPVVDIIRIHKKAGESEVTPPEEPNPGEKEIINGIVYGDHPKCELRDMDGLGASIDLITEKLTMPRDFSMKAYSIDGGLKWKSGVINQNQFSKLLDKGGSFCFSDSYNKITKKPTDEAVIVKFESVEKRPKANAEKLVANYDLYADPSGVTLGCWTLSTKQYNSDRTSGYQIAVTIDKKKPDVKGWGNFSSTGIPVIAGKTKVVYLIRSAPVADNGVYIPASKPWKITPLNAGKAPKTKVNYKNEIIKLKNGMAVFAGSYEELTIDFPIITQNDNSSLELSKIFVANNKKGVEFSIENYLSTDKKFLTIWTTASHKKPASEKQSYQLAARSELTPIALKGNNGKLTLDKKYEVLNMQNNKWGKLSKISDSITLPIRIKNTAKANGKNDVGNAASKTGQIEIEYGVYQEATEKKQAKQGILSATISYIP